MKPSRMSSLNIINLVYISTYGILLFYRGAINDDWVVVGHPLFDTIHFFKELGYLWGWPGHILGYLNTLESGIWLNHVLSFFLHLFSVHFLYRTLRSIKSLEESTRLVICLIFAIYPCYYMRIMAVHLLTGITHFCFFFGLWLVSFNQEKKSYLIRLLSLFLFLFSFSTNSIMVFYGILPIFLCWLNYEKQGSFRSWYFSLFKNMDYMLLPFVFLFVKLNYLVPFGVYAGYNEISINKVFSAFLYLPEAVLYNIIKPLKQLTYTPLPIYFIFLGIYLYFTLRRLNWKLYSMRQTYCAFGFGVLFFILAVYPYLLVDKLPSYSSGGFQTRHQILIPLGVSFIVVFGIHGLGNLVKKYYNGPLEKWLPVIYSILLTSMALTHFKAYKDYTLDWFKHEAVIEHFKNSKLIKDNHTFIINDQAHHLNALNRKAVDYEFTGFSKMAFGDGKRLFDHKSWFKEGWAKNKYVLTIRYNLEDYKEAAAVQENTPAYPQYEVIIHDRGLRDKFNMMFRQQFVQKEKYKQSLLKYIDVDVIPFKN